MRRHEEEDEGDWERNKMGGVWLRIEPILSMAELERDLMNVESLVFKTDY